MSRKSKRNQQYAAQNLAKNIAETSNSKAIADWEAAIHKDIEACMPAFGRIDEITVANPNYTLSYAAQQAPYVLFGVDNLYPNKVLDISTTNHNAARVARDFVAMLNVPYELQKGNAKAFMRLIKAEKLIERFAWDLVILGGMAAEVENVPNKFGIMKTIAVNPIRFANIRASKLNTYKNTAGWFTALDWTAIDLYGRLKYSIFQDKEAYEIKAHLPYKQQYSQSVYVDFVYHPSTYFYPVSDTECVFKQAEITGEIVNFHLSYLKNGMVGSVIINIPVPPMLPKEFEVKKAEILQKFNEHYIASRNAGKPVVYLAQVDQNGTPQQATFTGFPQDANDKRNLDLIRLVDEQTLIGLGYIDAVGGGNLGKAEALIQAYTLMEQNSVAPLRKKIETFFNELFANNGIADTFTLPFILPKMPEKTFTQTYVPPASN